VSIRVKRVYEKPEREDGVRILVDRLWPRGLSKDEAALDEWIRDVAPSDKLRTWFGHKSERWQEFQRRYKSELKTAEHKDILDRLSKIAGIATVTLLYAAKDSEHNNAVALASLLKKKKK